MAAGKQQKAMTVIEAIKKAIPLRDYLTEHGAVFVRGKSRCVFHEERTPSLAIYRGKDGFERAHCFGCRIDVDVIGAAMAINGLKTSDAIKFLTERAGFKHIGMSPANIKARKERAEKTALMSTFLQWERSAANELSELLRICRQILAEKKPPLSEPELEDLVFLQTETERLGYIYDIFCGCDDSEKIELFKEGYQ